MTDMKTEEHSSSDAEVSSENDVRKNLRERLYLPFGIPIVAAAVVALLGISFSRIFLTGAQKGEEAGAAVEAAKSSTISAPVLWATIITLVVLFGAAGLSAMKSMGKTTFTLIVLGGVVSVILFGSILAGSADPKVAAVDFGKPTEAELATADPNNVIEIDAQGTNTFQANTFNATAGVVKIRYVGIGGSHRLKFANDTRFNWFDMVANPGSKEEQDVVLEAGEYTVFCPIPGHEKMVAKLEVK